LNGLGLPWWVTLTRPVVVVVMGAGLAWAGFKAIAWFGERAMARARAQRWEARAEVAGDVRSAFSIFLTLGSVVVGGAAILDAPLGVAEKAAAVLSAFWCFAVLRIGIQYDWERQILERPRRQTQPGSLRSDLLANALILGTVLAGVVYVSLMPDRYDWRGMLWAVLGCGALFLLRFRLGEVVLTRLLARPARPEAVAIVSRAAAASGVDAPQALELTSPFVNAFACAAARAIGFTDTAVESLTDEELELVAKHELGHLRESMRVRLVRASFAMKSWLLVAFLPAIAPASKAVVYGAGCYFIVGVVERWWSRTLEHRADGHVLGGGDDNGAYVRVLQRLYELNLMQSKGASTHPDLDDRVVRAGGHITKKTKTKSRSKMGTHTTLAVLMVVGLFFLGLGLPVARDRVSTPAAADASAINWMVALRGDQAGLLQAGSLWAESGDLARAQRALDAVATASIEPESSLLRVGLQARRVGCSGARGELATLAYCDTEAECEARLRSICARRGASSCSALARRELRALVRHCGEPRLFERDTPIAEVDR
jgi:Zn-dependent protease with chaperone function